LLGIYITEQSLTTNLKESVLRFVEYNILVNPFRGCRPGKVRVDPPMADSLIPTEIIATPRGFKNA
jgi:hypothetical protein